MVGVAVVEPVGVGVPVTSVCLVTVPVAVGALPVAVARAGVGGRGVIVGVLRDGWVSSGARGRRPWQRLRDEQDNGNGADLWPRPSVATTPRSTDRC